MNTLTVRFLGESGHKDPDEYFNSLADGERFNLEYAPWQAFPYKPSVECAIAYTNDSILLSFFVEEKAIRAYNTQTNSAVYEDSCVEFFISFGSNGYYYNIECNCIGTLLIGYGNGRENRELLEPGIIEQITRRTIIHRPAKDGVRWEAHLSIPSAVFIFDRLVSFAKIKARGNFYKCGDLLPDPHFLCWNPVISAQPDFHLPAYFGELIFSDY